MWYLTGSATLNKKHIVVKKKKLLKLTFKGLDKIINLCCHHTVSYCKAFHKKTISRNKP